MRAAGARPRRRPRRRRTCRPSASSRCCSSAEVVTAVSTTRMLIGTCRAEPGGSRSTSCAMPSVTATSNPTVKPFNASVSPIATAMSTPMTTAALRCSAVSTDARTETWTTTTAVSGASTGRRHARDERARSPTTARPPTPTWRRCRSRSTSAASTTPRRAAVATTVAADGVRHSVLAVATIER